MSTFVARFDLPPTVHAPRVSRRIMRELLPLWGATCLREDAELLVSELVSNAVEHVGGEASFQLEVAFAGRWLRVSLADGSSLSPVVRELSTSRIRGRGMQMIVALADRWGVDDHHGGKMVWFELGLEAPASATG
jgi:hypothetical protein